MKDCQLLEFFEKHGNGKIYIAHAVNEHQYDESITLEDFYRMFELVREKRENGVRQD